MKKFFMRHPLALSKDAKRNQQYLVCIQACHDETITVQMIAKKGYQWMRKAGIHPHFFSGRFARFFVDIQHNHHLFNTALYLTFFSLKLPYEYKNTQYLQRSISPGDAVEIIRLFERRIGERIPVEYITQEAYYLQHTFFVNAHVLVPRSLMNTRFDDFLKSTHWENYRVLDLCTGSGCIGISLALRDPKIMVDLADISAEALEVAQKNIIQHGVEARVRCIQSDLFQKIEGKYDLIITNPPYVSTNEYRTVPQEFINEPKIALIAGDSGLDLIEKILFQAKGYLNARGMLIAEVGCTTAKRLQKKFPHLSFTWMKYRDMAGKESYWNLPGVFQCTAEDLPNPGEPMHRPSAIQRFYHRTKQQIAHLFH